MVVESKCSKNHQQTLRVPRPELIVCCRKPFGNPGTQMHLLPDPFPVCSHSPSSFLPLHTFPLLLPAICSALHPRPALAQVWLLLSSPSPWRTQGIVVPLVQSLIGFCWICWYGLYGFLFILLLLIAKNEGPASKTHNVCCSALSSLVMM